MNKEEFLKLLDALNFDKSEYCIIAGGGMLMYGLRTTTGDIDLKILPSLFDKLNNKRKLIKTGKFENHYEFNDYVELRVEGFNKKDVVNIDGYPVEALEKELEWKKNNKRSKDTASIKLIEEYLANNKNN